MPRDKKQKTGAGQGAKGEPPPPPLNNPFQAAKARLQEVVKKPPPPPPKAPAPAKGAGAPGPAGQGGAAGRTAAARPGGATWTDGGESYANRTLSDDELFLQEMAGVARMEARARSSRRTPEPAPETEAKGPSRPSEEAEVVAQLADLVQGTGAFDISDTDEYIEGLSPGLDAGLLRRLRKGDFAVQGHLDLHGLTAEEARVEVEKYLHEARLHRKRCVLLIHGRGLNSKDQIPVLKERLRVWLARGRLARSVLAFSTARPVDGGAGAVYVLLRR